MPNEEKALLRISGNGDVPVEEVAGCLAAIDDAYNGALLFIHSFDRHRRFLVPFPLNLVAPSRRPRRKAIWEVPEVFESGLSELVADGDRLVLRAVRLESPGWWEVFGKLNPLEVIRKYLKDRHERKKDVEYRNSAEKERLLLENQLRENQVLKERIEMAKAIGATDQDLAPLKNSLLGRPLRRLGHYQDQNVISLAEPVRPKS